MSDTELRELERRWQESGAEQDELRWLQARLRHEELDDLSGRWRLFLLAGRGEVRHQLWDALQAEAEEVFPRDLHGDVPTDRPRRLHSLLVCGPEFPEPREQPAYRAWDAVGEYVVEVRRARYEPAIPRDEASALLTRARGLRHEHLGELCAAVIDPDQSHFLVVDYGDADRLLSIGAPWGPDEALRMVRAVTAAVAVYHEAGLVYADLAPDRILLRPDGSPCLTPYGGYVLERTERIPYHGAQLTPRIPYPAYMSRSQILGREPLPSSDVFSLGVLLFHLLTGRPPWVSEEPNPFHVLRAVVMDPTPSILERRPDLPPGLDAVLHGALAKDVLHYPDARAFLADLDRLLAGETPTAPPPAPPPPPPPPSPPRSFFGTIRSWFA